MTAVARLKDVRKTRGTFSLEIAELTLHAARVHALLGPNGAGKSTLCSVLAGTSQVDSGSIELGSNLINRVGYAPQDTGLNLTMTGRENLEFFAALAGHAPSVFDEVCLPTVQALHLESLLDVRCRDLSVGQQRQIHVATGLVGSPSLVILDEPTSFMDVHARNRLYTYLDRLTAHHGLAVLYLTHEIHEVERLATECIVMNNGRFVLRGPLASLSSASDDWLVMGPTDLAVYAQEHQVRSYRDQTVVRASETAAIAISRRYSRPSEIQLSPPGLKSQYIWSISGETLD